MTGHYEQVARSIGQLVDEKQQLYGDSFGAAPAILRILYPDGVKPEQYESLLTMVRVLDKLKRIATDNDSDGENPWRDVGGYAVLEVGRRKNLRGSTPATVPHDGDLDDGETDLDGYEAGEYTLWSKAVDEAKRQFKRWSARTVDLDDGSGLYAGMTLTFPEQELADVVYINGHRVGRARDFSADNIPSEPFRIEIREEYVRAEEYDDGS